MKINTDIKKIEEILSRGVEEICPNKEALKKLLLSGKKIKLYCGYDPTGPNLHIGHAISLMKLSQFQELGHEIIFLIGDFTARIGDPDKLSARKKLTKKEVLNNLKNYKKQASNILKFSGKNPARIVFNSSWNEKMKFADIIEIASNFSVNQMLARDMFQERIKKEKPIYIHEFLYPVIQAYDCVFLDVDLEVGGNDQLFNIYRGRDLMKAMKNKEKLILTVKLLTDSDGKKMGKTEGNMVVLNETPREMFGKIMAWPDSFIINGLELCTEVPMEEIRKINENIKNNQTSPRDAKILLAKEIIKIHHGAQLAGEAEKEFKKVFTEKKLPSNIPEIKINENQLNILDLLYKAKLVSSKAEAKRLILQKGVKINQAIQQDWQKTVKIKPPLIIQVGKRKFIKVV